MRRPTALIAVAIALAIAAVPVAPAASGSAVIGVSLEIEAEAVPRFGIDTNRDGRIDLPNSPAYVHGRTDGCAEDCGTATFPVLLRGSIRISDSETSELAALPVFRYHWTISGPDLAEAVRIEGPMVMARLPEGGHWIELGVSMSLPWGSVVFRSTRPLPVDDVLVVAIGDSYASGEGNPEVGRSDGGPLWADGVGDTRIEASHRDAHRSTVAWPARVALALEAADRATSVTFVSLAASSASIEHGLIGPQPGIDGPGQLEMAERLVGYRTIDLLLISIGGNDIGFSRIIRELVDADRVFDPICYSTDLENTWAAARDGDWNRTSALRPGLPFGVECASVPTEGRPRVAGLDGLPEDLDRLAEAIAERLRVGAVVVAEYPDPTGRPRTGTETVCGEIVDDIFPRFRFLEIDRREQVEGRERIIRPLNDILRSAAGRHGWHFAGGVAESFADGHGYCAEWPSYVEEHGRDLDEPEGWYRNPGAVLTEPDPADRSTSWFRTAGQSSALQGPASRFETEGTLHPNELGHAAIARRVLAVLDGEPTR